MLPWLETVSMFPHCALSWSQCFHIASWVGVNVSTLWAELASMFPHCVLSGCQWIYVIFQAFHKVVSFENLWIPIVFIWKHWPLLGSQCGNIDTNSAHSVETLTPTQLTMWKHWCQLSTQCENIDTIWNQGSMRIWVFWIFCLANHA